MKNNASIIYNLCLVVGDFLALVLAFLSAFFVRSHFSSVPVAHPIHLSTFILVFISLVPFWIIIFALIGLYNSNIYEKRFSELGRLLVGSFIGMQFVIFWNFLTVNPIFPAKLVPIFGFIFAFIFLTILRNLLRFIRTVLFGYQYGLTKVLLVGSTAMTNELARSLEPTTSGYQVVGIVGNSHIARNNPDLKVFETFEEAIKHIGVNAVHDIMQTEMFRDEGLNRDILEFAQTHHISYRFVPGNSELFVGNIDVELFRSGVPVIAVHQTALLGWGRIAKRLFDLFVGILLLIVASPFMVVISACELMSGGNVFFRQIRLTRFNKEFKVYKLRTLKPEYNGLTPEEAFTKMGSSELIARYRKNGDQIENDPRFTKLGGFLRRTSLDELPQLFNIILGDISLVGPRPLVPEELSLYEKRHTILSVKSGLTGLAQVSGRKQISFTERRKLDLYYVQNWSFWLDLVILAKTVRVILKGS